MRVLLVDDHVLVRGGLCAFLEQGNLVEVIGEVSNGGAALELIRKLDPDLVLLDLTMPGMEGFEVLRVTREKFPKVRTIILTAHNGSGYQLRALRSGAEGFVAKQAASEELEHAIEKVMGGGKYFSLGAGQGRLFEMGLELEGLAPDDVVRLAALSPRQREVLIFIANGCSTKGIALHLRISVKTVESHRASLMDRLDIHDVASLVRFAVRVGLVSLILLVQFLGVGSSESGWTAFNAHMLWSSLFA